jgi:hypothetical protein
VSFQHCDNCILPERIINLSSPDGAVTLATVDANNIFIIIVIFLCAAFVNNPSAFLAERVKPCAIVP